MTRGGKRPGAGRPRGQRGSSVYVRLDLLARLDAYAAEHGLTRTDAMARAIRRLMERGHDS